VSQTDENLPAFVSAFLFAVNFVVAGIFLPESQSIHHRKEDDDKDHHDNKSTESFFKTVVNYFSRQCTGELLIIYFLFSIAFLVMQTNFSVFNQERFQFGPSENGMMLSYIGLLSLLSKPITPVSWLFLLYKTLCIRLWHALNAPRQNSI
jgi:DHA1 family tetracycline resistance protein-like MFS transporter